MARRDWQAQVHPGPGTHGEERQGGRMRIPSGRIAGGALVWALLCAAAPPVGFEPEAPRFARAAEEYRAIWAAEGARMIAALEAATGLSFPEAPVEVIVYEGVSWAGLGGRPMRLRASYSADEKRAALVHELGHRLIEPLPWRAERDEHRTLFLSSTTPGPTSTGRNSPTGWCGSSAGGAAFTIMTRPGPGRWRRRGTSGGRDSRRCGR